MYEGIKRPEYLRASRIRAENYLIQPIYGVESGNWGLDTLVEGVRSNHCSSQPSSLVIFSHAYTCNSSLTPL